MEILKIIRDIVLAVVGLFKKWKEPKSPFRADDEWLEKQREEIDRKLDELN